MHIKSIGLIWIVVKDIKKSVSFYTDVVGLKLEEFNEQYRWAEFSGLAGGARLGVAQTSEHEMIEPGANAVVTLTVDKLAIAKEELLRQGVHMLGDVTEIPGMVRLQMFADQDGNHFQLVECLNK